MNVGDMSFEGKVILITGAGSGIGAGAARHLSMLGAKISAVDINESRLTIVAQEINKSGSPTLFPIVADVTTDVERIVDETIKHFGKLDVLVNCAGIGSGDKDNVVDVNLSQFDRIFNLNVRSVVNLTKLCVPYLEKSKGNIVNISSYCGIRVFTGAMAYCMSKAAIDQFTRCSALDLAPKGIRVNSVNPWFIRTNLYESMGISSEQFENVMTIKRSKCPMSRECDVADTSAAIAFLADNKLSSFITGVSLPVDGGAIIA